MLYSGEFISQQGSRVKVEIVTRGSRTPSRPIGEQGLWFDTDPVTIANEAADTFETVIRRSATIRLQSEEFLSDLYAADCHDCAVTVTRGSDTLFMGYVEPMALSQQFTSAVETIELNCIDCLSALQYFRYGGTDHEAAQANATDRSLKSILTDCLAKASGPFPRIPVLFDQSRTLPGYSGSILSGITLPESLFLGEGEDEAWTLLEVVEESLRYLGLHILQTGGAFHIFSWQRVRQGTPITWMQLASVTPVTTAAGTVAISAANVHGTDTQLEIAECFSQVQLTCETTPLDELLPSPLDKDSLSSPYSSRQKYFTEIIMKEPGHSGQDGIKRTFFEWMAQGYYPKDFPALYRKENGAFAEFDSTCRKNAERAQAVEWFMQSMRAKGWQFKNDYEPNADLWAESNVRQHSALKSFSQSQCRAALVRLGSVTHEFSEAQDNAPQTRCKLDPCLVVSVNGNGIDTASLAQPSSATLRAKYPVAEYTGAVSGAMLSPADPDTVNYLVFSGKLTLAPLMELSCSPDDAAAKKGGYKYVPGEDGKDRMLTCRAWAAATPRSEPQRDGTIQLWPVSDHLQKLFKYDDYDTVDTVSKVPVLACMLVIGGKCLVESANTGTPSDFRWQPFKERGACADDDEFFAQSFTIGFNPKYEDHIIGQEHPVLNNVSDATGIDEEGTAIPIRQRDAISGRVRFTILGPVYSVWKDKVYTHKTWFRDPSWSVDCIPLLAHVAAIFIKDFEVKLVSDNAGDETDGGSDLVFISGTDGAYVNRKDDITNRIHSDLTAAERSELGINAAVNLSTARNAATGTGVTEITDAATGTTAKPEKLYVAQTWEEWHTPKTLLSVSMQDKGTGHEWMTFTHPALPGKNFHVQGVSRNLIEDSIRLDLKEI